MQANSIEEVIDELDRIIDWSIKENSRQGYFAALYRKVTLKVKEGIEQGEFEDAPRMQRFDVIFANRYLKAFEQYQNGEPTTTSWLVTFDATKSWTPTVIQHLLLAMNAHINLDLGIAAAQTSPGSELDSLKNDFNKINEILGQLIGVVENDLAKTWPLLKFIDKAVGDIDTKLAGFSMDKARDAAWNFATCLAPLDEKTQQLEIQKADFLVDKLGLLIQHPGKWPSIVLFVVRIGERGTIAKIIETLK